MEAIAKLVKEVADQFDSEEVSFYNGYSGRGMYGSKCIGIVGSHDACMRAIGEMIKLAHERSASDDDLNFDEVVDTLMDMSQDSMGRDIILYWPQLDFDLPDNEPQHDGQPDEQQEWHDFDPDC